MSSRALSVVATLTLAVMIALLGFVIALTVQVSHLKQDVRDAQSAANAADSSATNVGFQVSTLCNHFRVKC